jgi:hypothetical protein
MTPDADAYRASLARSIVDYTRTLRRVGGDHTDPLRYLISGIEHAWTLTQIHLFNDYRHLGDSSALILSDACQWANACPDCLAIGPCDADCPRIAQAFQ